jgi:hypothetical protein
MKKLLATLLLLTASAFAQFRADTFVTVSSGGGAYVSPMVRLGFEPSFDWQNGWRVAGSFSGIPTGKIDTRDGFTSSNRVEVAKNLNDWTFGLGGSYSYTQTSLYSKHASRPYLLISYAIPDDAGVISVRTFGPWGDERNGLFGPEITYDIPLKGNLGMRMVMSVFSVYPTDAPQLGRTLMGQGGGGITYDITDLLKRLKK